MRYVYARGYAMNRERAYRYYVTDALKCAYGLNVRYADLFKPEDTRTADEIITDMKSKLSELKDGN